MAEGVRLSASRVRPSLIVGAVVALALVHGLSYGLCVQDDTFISLRYAANLVAGQGLVYNAGERVEGYTNFLWTLILAGAMALGANPVLSAVLGGLACAAGLVWWVSHPVEGGERSWGAPLIVALLPGFILEAVQGLETAGFALLVALGLWASSRELMDERRFPASAIWFGLASLTRPEGVLLYAWTQAFALFSLRSRPGRSRLFGWGILGAVVGGHLAFRLAYYGLPLPNTFYAKTGGGIAQWARGLGYIGSFVSIHPFFSALSLLGVIAWLRLGGWRRMMAGAVVLYGLYVVAVGGDFKPTFRFIWPVLGPLALIVTDAVHTLWAYGRRGRIGVALVVCGALLVDGSVAWKRMHREATFRAQVMEDLLTVGGFLRDHLPRGTVLAIHSAGTIPFASGLRTLDLWGITDAHIAHREVEHMGAGVAGHEKTDYEWAFRQSPDLYLPELDLLSPEPRRLPVPQDFPADFERRYESLSIRIGDQWINLFRRLEDPVSFTP